ncbi:MAG TPA: HAMP domain-containing sensor histidine kinase [Candidatus Limnocylindrales bacterium]|nr:HAMP domain-containing sensor histidine kinase [Candidatus Limnocylindrales bacterium]
MPSADRFIPHSFQARLTGAFVAVVAVTVALVAVFVINREGAYFDQQQRDDLSARANGVATYIENVADLTTGDTGMIVSDQGIVNPAVATELSRAAQQRILADRIAQADVHVQLGRLVGGQFVAASNGDITALQQEAPLPGEVREPITSEPVVIDVTTPLVPYAIEVTLSNPYTFRAAAIANVTGLIAVIGLAALGVAVIVSAMLARRFTTPLRRLTEASNDLAEGDLARRVPAEALGSGAAELTELALQFNAMAGRLQESVDTIRRDRDRSREFLADVSHELRTPIAALRTFNELLVEGAASDPSTRTEFLEASRAQLERLDWLAQNLLELSKLDSGLVLLDLRPDDVRSAVESAIEQATPTARRRGIELNARIPDEAIRVRHDPVRIGQVVTNLVGNALKFTPRGGRVDVAVRGTRDGGAEIQVSDTGVGIDPAELPRIFDRFFRGSRASEARSSGSGLGLAIVRSIVEMHGGTVDVESRLGEGSTFTVTLPRQPREPGTTAPRVAETSPGLSSNFNPEPAP